MDLDTVKRAIRESTELSKQGDNQRALRILDESIADALRENHDRWVRVLSRHASAISDSMADLTLVRPNRHWHMVPLVRQHSMV